MSELNQCIRCGKKRIEAKKWSEHISGSLVTYTLNVCPDPECQKIVEEQLQRKRDKITAIQKKSLERRKMINRKRKHKTTTN